MLGETQDDHRKTQRRPTLKGGHIVFNHDRSTFDCTVRNLSRHGAKLQVGSPVGIPDTFDLMLPPHARQPCKVVWRKPARNRRRVRRRPLSANGPPRMAASRIDVPEMTVMASGRPRA